MTSASSPQGKRKRNTSHLPVPPSSTELQPSSRDASGEEGPEEDTNAPANVTRSKSKKTSAETAPVSKRARKSSDHAGANGHKEDPGEPSETTIGSSDIEQEKVTGRLGSQIKGPAGEGEQNAMPPPQRGGLQDPVGYHTNPPPTGRAVRVYADGVFDLFHLGYVSTLNRNRIRC